MNGPLNKEQTEQAREIWGGGKSDFRREYASQWEVNLNNCPFSIEEHKKRWEEAKEPTAMDKFCADLIDRSFERNNPLIPSFKEVNQSCEIKLLSSKLIDIQNLAHSALDQNRILADKTVLDYDPCGYCPPEKRKMLLDTLREIIETTK